jgi:hypothetical protein
MARDRLTERQRWAEIHQLFEGEVGEEKVLSLNPINAQATRTGKRVPAAFGLLLLLSLFVARLDYVAEHLLHFLNRICLRQLGKNKS